MEAMEKVVAMAQDPSAADNTAVLVQAMAHLPGWDEKNFQVKNKAESSPVKQPRCLSGFAQGRCVVGLLTRSVLFDLIWPCRSWPSSLRLSALVLPTPPSPSVRHWWP